MSRRKGWAGARDGPARTTLTTLRRIGSEGEPVAIGPSGRRQRQAGQGGGQGGAPAVLPRCHQPRTGRALTSHVSPCSVLRPRPRRATNLLRVRPYGPGVHVPPRPATAQFVTLASLDARRPPPDAGARRLPAAASRSYQLSQIELNLKRPSTSSSHESERAVRLRRLRVSHPVKDPREDGERSRERDNLWLVLV